MSKLIWGASALMALTSAVHIFAGTSEIMQPIRAADLHPIVIQTAMVVWHVISLLLILMTLALAYLARQPNAALWAFIIAIQLSFTVVFLYYTLTGFGALFALPQWTVFLLTAALMIAARPKAV